MRGRGSSENLSFDSWNIFSKSGNYFRIERAQKNKATPKSTVFLLSAHSNTE